MIDHLQATYHDLKTVKTRDSVQLILELPMASLPSVIELLGPPVSGESVWVVVARIREPQASAPAIEQQPEPEAHQIEGPANDDEPGKPPRPLSQQAAFLCTVVAFRKFLQEERGFEVVPTVDEAAVWMREACGVRSRAELDTDSAAASNFRHLRAAYRGWLAA